MISESKKAKLRFAALIRVSTERQAEKGNSLRTQRELIEFAVKNLSGTIVETYGGQEHATPGFEKQEVDRLLRDSTRGKFDAVMVAYHQRWSRDNEKSKAGLRLFREHKIRFYVGGQEVDLFSAAGRLLMGMMAEAGEFTAISQKEQSIVNRISNARKGWAAVGKLPFGRTFDKKTKIWGLNLQKRAIIVDVAKRYLAGENIAALAEEYGMNGTNLHKLLTKRSGDEWTQQFTLADLNIHEEVTIKIPRLLPETTIKAIYKQIAQNKTYEHGSAKRNYLLSGFIYCEECGYAMTGLPGRKRSYYRHSNPKNRVRRCPGPIPNVHIRASEIESVIVQQLFDCFGNPAAVKRAIEEATPNREKMDEFFERQKQLTKSLKDIDAGRQRILALIAKGTISEEDAETQLTKLKEREAKQRKNLQRIDDGLSDMPTAEQIKAVAELVAARIKRKGRARRYGDAKLAAKKRLAMTDFDAISPEEKRALIVEAFEDGETLDGKPMGVYIKLMPGYEHRHTKRFRFTIHGRIRHSGYVDAYVDADEGETNGIARSALHCRGEVPPARHSHAPPVPHPA